MKNRPILSVDFREERQAKHRQIFDTLTVHMCKTFGTSEGMAVLAWMKESTRGKLCRGSSHEMAAAAGRRDLVDEIEDMINEGLDRLSR